MRHIYEIASEIKKTWKNIDYYAKPYLNAMFELTNITDTYICDSAKSIILYFLANASTWRGEDARRIKAELKSMCGIK